MSNFYPRRVQFYLTTSIDWNTIYDMQEAGTWTWEAFEEMLNKITRDTDNDGVNDIYGILGSSDDMYVCATFANGGSFFDFDENGKLRPTMNSDATIDALTWGEKIQQQYWAPTPANANWDWYKDSWKQGYCGFYMYQAYGGFNDNSEMADMADEWGCVAFPVPNKGDNYITVVSDNVTLIPSCYDEETVAKLAFLYDMWTNDTPGVETEGDWIGNKYNYTDERAVDETYAMLREPEHCRVNKALYLGTQNDVLGNSLLWQLGESTPAELIEAGMSRWQALCDEFNAANPYDKRDDEPDDQRPETSLIAFVNRNYSIILGREADPTGQTNWVNALTSGRITGAELMYGFLNSMEFKQKNLSDEDKVEIMYNAMLGRGSDPNGKSFWVDHLKIGMSINAIADGFVRSREFIDLCGHYGISNGTYQLNEDRDKNFKVTAFVNNCYNEALNRGPDVDGMNNWCGALLNKQLTAEQVVHGFVDSEEMKSRNLSNEEYVSKMYALYLDREPDQSGFEFWVNKLNNGEGRDKIEQGFAQSVEFKEIVAGYGLNERK